MLKKIYNKSPRFFQDIFLTLQAYRYRRFRHGGYYREFLSFLQKSQYYSEEQLLNWQINQFKSLFGEAYDNTKYYKKIFDEIGVDPRDIKNFDFLKNVPLLTKDSLRVHPDDFINRKRKIVYTARTGGTTGAPLVTPFDAESTQRAFAFLARFFEQSNVKYGSRNLHMTGQQVVPLNEKKKFWRKDIIGNSIYLSIHHLSPSTFPIYWKRIMRFKPEYIFGYTSFIYDLARQVNGNGQSGQLILKGVFPSSEKITEEMRAEMERAFTCKVYDHYGSTEGIPLITQCSQGNYHIVPESGIIEFLNPDGTPAEPGQPAEMYMTSLRQFSRPILRYKIGDTAIYSEEKCSCGLNWKIIKELTGRLSEWVKLEDGRRISQFSHQVFKLVSTVQESQIIQHSYTEFEVLVVKDIGYSIQEEEVIKNRITELLGQDISINFKYVNEIPKTSGGKKPSLISKVI